MRHPYRDALETIRDQISALDRSIADTERSFTAAFWTALAPGLGLAPPRKLASPGPAAEQDALMLALSEREERARDLERIEADYPRIEALWRTPPDGPPPRQRVRSDLQTLANSPLSWPGSRAEFEAVVARLFPDRALEHDEKRSLGFVVRAEGVPFSVTYQPFISGEKAWEPQVIVATLAAPGAGELRIVPQTMGREILSGLGLIQDIRVGNDLFDATFVIKGDEVFARAVLTPEVRSDILSFCGTDPPWVEVQPGLARIWWRYDLSEAAVRMAIRVVGAIRRSDAFVPLRTTAARGSDSITAGR